MPMIEFEKLNDLAPEVKILLVNAQTTLDDARAKMKAKGLGIQWGVLQNYIIWEETVGKTQLMP